MSAPFDPRTPENQALLRERWRTDMRDLLHEKVPDVTDEKIEEVIAALEADVEVFAQKMRAAGQTRLDP